MEANKTVYKFTCDECEFTIYAYSHLRVIAYEHEHSGRITLVDADDLKEMEIG